MVRRLVRAIGQTIGRRNRTCATAPGMRRWYTPTAASVPIASARNADRSTMPSCMPLVSRVFASKGRRYCRAPVGRDRRWASRRSASAARNPRREERMDLILIILVLVLLFGGGFGDRRWGYEGGGRICGILLIVL